MIVYSIAKKILNNTCSPVSTYIKYNIRETATMNKQSSQRNKNELRYLLAETD